MKRKKIIVVFITVTTLIVLFILIFRNFSPKNLTSDNDPKFYISSKNKMIYSPQSFSIENTDNETCTLFFESQKRNYICNNIAKIKDCIVYSNNDGLYIENSDGDVDKVYNSFVSMFVPSKEKIYFINETDDLYIYNLNTEETNIISFDCGNIEWIGIDNEKLYIKCVIYQDDSISEGKRWKGGKQAVTFLSLNSITMSQDYSFCLNTKNDFETVKPLLSGGKLYYVYSNINTETNEIYSIDFQKKSSELVFQHDHITNIVSNDDSIYFTAERVIYSPLKNTDNNFKSKNGLWKYDINSGEKIKISDECVYEDLLLTNNYLYCYKILYLFPRGLFENVNLGYSIVQLPV